MPHQETTRRIAVIGGGIAGLSTVLELQRIAPATKIVVLESTDRLGGVLDSQQRQGFTVEHSADMFTTDPPVALDLIRRLGFESKLLTTIPTEDRAYVATRAGIEPIPRGFSLMLPNNPQAVLDSSILSDQGKRRFLDEERVPPKTSTRDESLHDFALRRFGQEVFERLIQPLASGIYTADPRQLSMRATMKRFLDMEQEFGSLIGAAKAKSANVTDASATSGAQYGLFRAPEKGIGAITRWIVDACPGVQWRLGQPVTAIQAVGNQWQVKTSQASIVVDGVVLATSAGASGGLLDSVDRTLGQLLATITAASSAIIVQAFDRRQFAWRSKATGQAFGGYGIIFPDYLKRSVIACSFSSNKFPNRAPQDKVLVRTFMGGALNAGLVDLPDLELSQTAAESLQSTVQLSGPAEWTHVYRWRHCMPQYTLNHLQRVAQIENRTEKLAGIELAGNSYRGVGIPACIESGMQAAARIVAAKC